MSELMDRVCRLIKEADNDAIKDIISDMEAEILRLKGQVAGLKGAHSAARDTEQEAMDDEVDRRYQAVKMKGVDTDWTMYNKISRNEGLNACELAKKLKWSHGKAYGSIKRLEKNGLVRLEKVEKNGRLVLSVTPEAWEQFFTNKELDEFKEIMFE